MYWAQALAGQTDDPALAARFAPLAARVPMAAGGRFPAVKYQTPARMP